MRYVGMPAEQITTMRQEPFWAGFEVVAPTLAYDHTAIFGPRGAVPKHRLAAVGMPTLAMCGGSSPAFMCATARTIQSRGVQRGVPTLEGQSHDAQPAVVARVLIEFLGVSTAQRREDDVWVADPRPRGRGTRHIHRVLKDARPGVS